MASNAGASISMTPGEIILDKFKVIDRLGQGGMGSVYRVDHLVLHRQFALKCLNKQHSDDVSWRRFQNEAKAAGKLDHPNLIKVHEFDLLPDGRPYILMDLVQGETLSDITKHTGSLPVERAINIIIQVAFAINYAHEQGIIHRDLKPTNIMVMPSEVEGEKEAVKVVDFGIAKLTGMDEFNQQTLTKTGEIFGSPLYMSPEQCTGTMVDHRTDIYSIGCVFYELLTGAPPFIGENALSTMMKHQTETPLSLKEASLGTSFSPHLEKVVTKMLAKDPNLRYQNGNALVMDLLPLVQQESDANTLKLQPQKAPAPPRQGQTTQLLQGSSKPKFPNQKNNSKLLFAVIATAIICFGAGYATCYFTYKLNTPANQAAPVVTSNKPEDQKPVEYYSKIEGKKRVFRFPPGLSLGLFCFGDLKPYEASMKLPCPANLPVGLFPSQQLIEHPVLWDGFRKNELSVISFQNVKGVDGKTYEKLANFPNLKILSLCRTNFSAEDIKYLTPLTSLLSLNMGFCQKFRAKDVEALTILNKLNILDVSDMKDCKLLMPTLGTLNNLNQLTLRNCDLCDDDMTGLSRNRSIKVLGVGFNAKLGDTGVSHLKAMKQVMYLVLSGTSVTPKCVESLAQMPNLKTVEVAENGWTKLQQEQFKRTLSKTHPKIVVDWVLKQPHLNKIVMPDFAWEGPGVNSDGFVEESHEFVNQVAF